MSYKILLVDDESLAIDLLQKNLMRRGYDVITANNGEEGLALVDNDCAVLVTDIIMPKMDGIALLSQAKERCANLIAIAMTSFADKDRVIAALNAGADYLLEKPFTADALVALVERLLTAQKSHVQEHLSSVLSMSLGQFALSDADQAMVLLVVKGYANKQIAFELGLKEQTVKNRISSIFSKLGISSRSELFQLLFPIG